MMPDTTSSPYLFSVATASRMRQPEVLVLRHRLERLGLGRLDAAEDRYETGVAHQRQDPSSLAMFSVASQAKRNG